MDTVNIQAAVSRGAGRPMKIEPLEMEEPRADELLVRLVASGVCHTDLWMRECGGSGAVVLGHEGAGVVERVGSAVRGLRRGDHVVLSYQSCGRCGACRRGRPVDCEHFWDLNFGFARLDGSNALAASGVRGHFFGQSSFATHALATARNAVKVSKTLPLEMLAPLGCGLQTGAATVLIALAVRPGASVAIFGTGSVGLAAVMAARVVGADPIVAVDIRTKRLALARELGATHVIDARRAQLAREIDFAVDTTGEPSIERTARRLLHAGGALALLAGGGASEELPGGRRVLSLIQGNAVPQEFIPRMIRMWRQGRFPFDRLVRFYKFREINRAFADSARGAAIKPVLRIGS